GGAFLVRASLTAPATQAVTVQLAFSGSAQENVDYTVTGEPLVIPIGATSRAVTVLVENDGASEGNETIAVDIANVVSVGGGYGEVGTQTVTVTILDTGIPGDADGDGDVDYYDLLELISEYGRVNPGPEDLDCDFDGDGDVDYYDLLILIANYGTGAKAAPAAGEAGAGDGETVAGPKVAGPSASISLVGPDRVQPGDVFNVDLYVQVDDPAGFGGGPLDIDFTTSKLNYAGTFNPSTIIQDPFKLVPPIGTLDEAGGRIVELGGSTVSPGNGYGAPVLYARMSFQAMANGTATFSVSAGTVELLVVGGKIPFANTNYGAGLTVTVAEDNTAPVANAAQAATGQEEPVDITLTASDADGDTLFFNLPAPGHAWYPQHGDITIKQAPANGVLVVTYTPDAGYAGNDGFTYTVDDGDLTSAPATVSITVGGFVTDIHVSRAGNPYITLAFGMQPGATKAFIPAEGDYLAPPPGTRGESAYFIGPFGEQLSRDIRGIGESETWKLVVLVPGNAAKENWGLAWDGASLPAGYISTLTPATADWQPDGAPVDMTATETAPLDNTGTELVTYRFLVVVSTEKTVALALKAGWNLVGVPVILDAADQAALLGHPDILAVYEYSLATGYSVPTQLLPGKAYWMYAAVPVALNLTGVPSDGPVPVHAGWNFVAPYDAVPNPLDGVTIIAVWAWSPDVGYYIPDLEDPQAIGATTGLWIYATGEGTVW
ncbi:MAG: cadherin-like domain-containing protein, partial [Lentisphaeria bacterium]|nr:cadherin-like domain-containing protein [Lentisphaeria bacterium]